MLTLKPEGKFFSQSLMPLYVCIHVVLQSMQAFAPVGKGHDQTRAPWLRLFVLSVFYYGTFVFTLYMYIVVSGMHVL